MKYLNLYLTLFILFLLSSCERENEDDSQNNNTTIASFKFNLNNTSYEVIGSLAESSTKGVKIERRPDINQYYFHAKDYDPTFKFYLFFTMPNPIAIGTYTFTTSLAIPGGEWNFNGFNNYFGLYKTGDSYTVIIEKVENGNASGTFSASRLSMNGSDNRTYTVTNGEFKNVKILN